LKEADGLQMYSGTAILTYFYPVLVKGLGYTDPVMAQYMTVRHLFSLFSLSEV
jgi:hypothetical protein